MAPEPRSPRELSTALNDAFNRRDAAGIRALLADEIDYRTPELHTTSPEAVIGRYLEAWARLPNARGEVERIIEDGETAIFIVSVWNGDERVFDNIAIHEWRQGRLVTYRMWRNAALP